MCEVASSDATNIKTTIRQEGNEIVINGHKWYARSPLALQNLSKSCLAGTSAAQAIPDAWST